jgi:hypothetical protein
VQVCGRSSNRTQVALILRALTYLPAQRTGGSSINGAQVQTVANYAARGYRSLRIMRCSYCDQESQQTWIELGAGPQGGHPGRRLAGALPRVQQVSYRAPSGDVLGSRIAAANQLPNRLSAGAFPHAGRLPDMPALDFMAFTLTPLLIGLSAIILVSIVEPLSS